MTSDTPEPGEGRSHPDPQLSAGDLTAFLRAGLRTVVDELGRTNELRAEMAGVLSANLLAMAAAPDPARTGEKIAVMIGALQNDDRIRQRIEGLAGSLQVMLSAMEEAGGTARPVKEDWARALVDSQRLDELAESFGAGLAASGESG